MAPETGRWLTPDPPVKAPDPKFMAAPWALHPYQYVNQNPVLFWDPDGRQPAPNPAGQSGGPAPSSTPSYRFPVSVTDLTDRLFTGDTFRSETGKLAGQVKEVIRKTFEPGGSGHSYINRADPEVVSFFVQLKFFGGDDGVNFVLFDSRNPRTKPATPREFSGWLSSPSSPSEVFQINIDIARIEAALKPLGIDASDANAAQWIEKGLVMHAFGRTVMGLPNTKHGPDIMHVDTGIERYFFTPPGEKGYSLGDSPRHFSRARTEVLRERSAQALP